MRGRRTAKLNSLSMDELVRLREQVQAALSRKVQQERAALESKLGELVSLEGGHGTSSRRSGRRSTKWNGTGAATHSGRRAKKRTPVYVRYYDSATGKTYSNRGPMATWLREKREAGENIEKKYRVSETNPLPRKLAKLTPPS